MERKDIGLTFSRDVKYRIRNDGRVTVNLFKREWSTENINVEP